jgi:16S rRNA (cytosine967-C5)-methyltransferase
VSLESALQLDQNPGAASSDAKRAAAALAHPKWLFDRLKTERPESLEAICDGNNARPPMTLRVNLSKISRNDYLERLGERGIDATLGGYADTALVLREPCHVDDLPGFRDGLVSVQDEASQIVPSLLQLRPGLSLVDACAAPGGKTAAILERETALKRVVAIDSSKKRLARVTETLGRLALTEQPITLCTANAENLDAWWDGNPIDRILLDAPCSATGVIRRHPDIKVLRTPDEVASCCESQQTLLVGE